MKKAGFMLRMRSPFGVMLFIIFGLTVSVLKVQAAEEQEKTVETAPQKVAKEWTPKSPSVLYLNLNDCLQRAYAYNGQLRVHDYDIDVATGKLQETKRIGKPVVEYEYNLAPAPRDLDNPIESFFNGDISVFNRLKVGVGVPLTTFGKLSLAQSMAQEGILAESLKQKKEKVQIASQIQQLYYGILLAREFRHLLNRAYQEVKKEIEKREEKGGSDPLQLLKLKIFLSDLESKIEESDQKELLAKEALRVQLGIDAAVRFNIKGSKLRPVSRKLEDFQIYSIEATQGRQDLKLLDVGHRVRRKNYLLEKKYWVPDLGVGAFLELGIAPGIRNVDVTNDFLDPFNFKRAGVGFRLKGKFDYAGGSAKVKQARAELYKIEIQRELAERGINLEVKKAYLDVKKTKSDIKRAEIAQKLSRQLLFLTQSNFDIGLADPKDLVDAISSFLKTRGEYFKAVFDYNVAVSVLDEKVGRAPDPA
jgi:outer membrane protein